MKTKKSTEPEKTRIYIYTGNRFRFWLDVDIDENISDKKLINAIKRAVKDFTKGDKQFQYSNKITHVKVHDDILSLQKKEVHV